MAITASYYVINADVNDTPYISINIVNCTSAQLEYATSAYMVNAELYKQSYIDAFNSKENVANRLLADLCMETSSDVLLKDGEIDLENNTVRLHVKADDIFSEAKNSGGMTSETGVTKIANAFTTLYNTWYTEGTDNVLVTADSAYKSETAYDANAYTVGIEITEDIPVGVKFINVIPNAVGTKRVYKSYEKQEEEPYAYVNKYIIDHEDYEVSSGVTSSVWVASSVDAETAVAYTTVSVLDENTEWTIIN